ncbi:hypothetical protein [Streptomyces botrytidirepellens]|uniref:Uncharacterized protein n=1 Tax=Streptomyces botrytidirepellens TaxID=2486417 RepID=A0A3M8WIS1_9ACTN|nr:hypothetical protein [Streptomyces botrytidirepellens]RNG28739.1 hypothetical protein EEJ42_12050 [Streptomyces botrytidirepellens]
MFLPLTIVRDEYGVPVATVTAQFIASTFLPHTWLVIATPNGDEDRGGGPDGKRPVHLDSYGPFTDPDGARAWAEAHLTPYALRYTVVPLTAPWTDAETEAARGKPLYRSATARPARANTVAKYFKPSNLTRLRHTTPADTPRHGFTARELEHPELGPVVQLTALGSVLSIMV